MTGPAVRNAAQLTVQPGDDRVRTWQRIADLALASGLPPLPAGRLALAAVELVGTPARAVAVELATITRDDGQARPAVQATVRGGSGTPASLLSGLVDIAATRTSAGGTAEHVVSVRLTPAPGADPTPSARHEPAAGGTDPLYLLACAFALIERLTEGLRLEDQATTALRAELDEADHGLLAVHAEMSALQDQLEHARAGAEQASSAKGAFLANVCHEIRSPINAITGFTGLLLGTALTLEQSEYVETIRVTGSHLLGLIGDVLDVSKIEAGRLEVENIPLDLIACVEDSVAILAPQADQKGLVLAALFAPDTPEQVIGDPLRLRQILVNLLSNAVKFTAHGQVTVSVDHQRLDASSARLTFRVTDTGIGVPAEVLQRLFTPFTQASAATSRTYGGTGLGLSICRQLCEHMGGGITAESAVGKGSTFTATVTVGLPAPDGPAPRAGQVLAGTDILIACSHPVIAEALRCHLTACGAATLTTDTLGHPGTADHDLAVLHLDQPERFAELTSGRRDRPLVVVTPLSQRGPLIHAGVPHPVVSLPVRRHQLRDAVFHALGEPPATGDTPASRPQTQNTAAPAASPLPAVGTVLYVDDNPLMIQLIERIFTRIPHVNLLTAANGTTALELATTRQPDLILLDLNLPDIVGHDLLKYLRSDHRTTTVPVVIISGEATPETIQLTARLGATRYLAKPFKAAELQQLVQDAIPAPAPQ